MVKQATVPLAGVSGRRYDFEIYPWGTQFNRVGAVYAVLRQRPEGNFNILYIGQTGDLSERFDNHHQQTCFTRNGKTHLGVYTEPTESRRLGIESDLRGNYNTPCNEQ